MTSHTSHSPERLVSSDCTFTPDGPKQNSAALSLDESQAAPHAVVVSQQPLKLVSLRRVRGRT